MNDKELLELAAKAAGYTITDDVDDYGNYDPWFGNERWNPLHSSQDAFELMVDFHVNVTIESYLVCAGILETPDTYKVWIEQEVSSDLGTYAATCRAIVRAAAEIGRGME